MPFEFFQITAAYSNALLVAVMPHISDFSEKLDLPTQQPVTPAQVERFNCFPRSDHIGGRLILTNGCAFVFDHGRVESFESADTFAYLQDPNLIPKFYGPVKLTEDRALKIAHDAIKTLGYTDEMLAANRQPEIIPPPKDRGHFIARYRVRWTDPTRGGNPNHPPTSIEFEINATTGRIQMVKISNPNTYQSDPKIAVKPPVVKEGPKSTPVGAGRKITPVSAEYAREFLTAILPQISNYARRAGLTVKSPITSDDVDMPQYLTKYNCGIVDDDTTAQIDLKSGDRFIYSHGQVIAFYAADAHFVPLKAHPATFPDLDAYQKRFFGPVNMTTNEAIAFVQNALAVLGYSQTILHTDKRPRVDGPAWWGTNRICRCFIEWRESVEPSTYVNAEVDVSKKTLKSLYINDHAITNIWRAPPKVDAPIEQQETGHE